MKIRYGFVANSSSSTFIIINRSRYNKTLRDLLKELMISHKEALDAQVKKYIGTVSLNMTGKAMPLKRGLNLCEIGGDNLSTIGELMEQMLVSGRTKSFEYELFENNH